MKLKIAMLSCKACQEATERLGLGIPMQCNRCLKQSMETLLRRPPRKARRLREAIAEVDNGNPKKK